MLCQECGKRPATLHFTKIVNGEKTEFRFCEECAREKGEVIPGTSGGFSIHNLLSGFLDFNPNGIGQKSSHFQSQNLRCEACGLSYAQFSKIGRFGCSSCYKYFNDHLDPLFKRVHGNTVHVGKIPKRAGKHIQTKRKIEDLRQTLQNRIQQEEFEEAAAIRDQIRELEKNISTEQEG